MDKSNYRFLFCSDILRRIQILTCLAKVKVLLNLSYTMAYMIWANCHEEKDFKVDKTLLVAIFEHDRRIFLFFLLLLSALALWFSPDNVLISFAWWTFLGDEEKLFSCYSPQVSLVTTSRYSMPLIYLLQRVDEDERQRKRGRFRRLLERRRSGMMLMSRVTREKRKMFRKSRKRKRRNPSLKWALLSQCCWGRCYAPLLSLRAKLLINRRKVIWSKHTYYSVSSFLSNQRQEVSVKSERQVAG